MGTNMIIGPCVGSATQGALLKQYPAVLDDGNTWAWYDSSDLDTIIKNESELVSRWNDKLLSGHDLIQITDTKKPKYEDDGILFDGINDIMKTLTAPLIQPIIIYIVFKQISWTAADVIFDGFIDNSCILFQFTASPQLRANAGANSANVSMTLDTFGIIRLLFNGASSKLIINDDVAVTGNFGLNNMNGFTLGSRVSETNFRFANIKVKDIIIRSIAETTENETDIYQYLTKKNNLIPDGAILTEDEAYFLITEDSQFHITQE